MKEDVDNNSKKAQANIIVTVVLIVLVLVLIIVLYNTSIPIIKEAKEDIESEQQKLELSNLKVVNWEESPPGIINVTVRAGGGQSVGKLLFIIKTNNNQDCQIEKDVNIQAFETKNVEFLLSKCNNILLSDIIDIKAIPIEKSSGQKPVEDSPPQGNIDELGIIDRDINNPKNTKYNGYIIEFEDEPIIVRKTKLEKEGGGSSASNTEYVKNNIKDYKTSLRDKNNQIKSRISNEISDLKILNEFDTAFNGIALDITDEEAEQIKNIPGVKDVSPNYEVQTLLMDSVPLIQGGIQSGKLDEDGNDCTISGKPCFTGEGVTIAIIDTGIDYTHPDLGGCTQNQFLSGTCSKVIGGWDFVNTDNDPMDDAGHGTHVAGIAAGNGVLDGVAPDAKLYAYKVLSSFGSGSFANIISAIERSVDPNQDGDYSDIIDVISLSLGGFGNPDDPMSQAIDNVVNAGIIAVVAAGNSGPSSGTINSPGTARNAITVGATYKKDYSGLYWLDQDPIVNQITSFSSRGPVIWNEGYINKPDIVAPGAIICSSRYDNIYPEGSHQYYKPCLDDKHVQIAGTSMATPMVSGAAALLKQRHPDWSPEEIKNNLKYTASDLGYDINTQGFGLVNLTEAISLNYKALFLDLKTVRMINPIQDGNLIDITGTVKGDNFNSYTLYYGLGEDPDSWNEIITSESQVDNGILYSQFNVNILSEGINWFRIVALDNYGKSYQYKKSIIKTFNFHIATNYNGQVWPAIYGDKIVWVDAGGVEENYDLYEIYMYDLSTNQERRITTDSYGQFFPSIYGDKIVWFDDKSGDDLNRDIYMYDLSTNQERSIASGSYHEFSPHIYGNKIVFVDLRNGFPNYDIYMYDLSTNQERRITSNSGTQNSPNIYENKIVWEDNRHGGSNWEIYMYDLGTSQERRITSAQYNQVDPKIYGDKIVWVDYRNSEDINHDLNGDIYMYDLSTGEERVIASGPYDQYDPAIYGDKIVWSDYINGNWDIYMYDLSTCEEKVIIIDPYEPYRPMIYNNKIVWSDYINGNWDIFMYDLSIPLQLSWCSGADMNRDGKVDTADYIVWRKLNGCVVSSSPLCSNADANHDGIVNGADYDIWKAHSGERNCIAF